MNGRLAAAFHSLFLFSAMPKKFADAANDTRGGKAKAQKKASQAEKDAAAAAKKEAGRAKDWAHGADARGEDRRRQQDEKALAAQMKRDAKAALLAAEDAELSTMKKTGKARKAQLAEKKKKGKGGSDLSVFGFMDVQASSGKKGVKKASAKSKKSSGVVTQQDPLQRNLNHVARAEAEEAKASGVFEASGVDGALNVLSLAGAAGGAAAADAHPERRMKAAYAAYEEREMEIMRKENPGLKRSQLKQAIFKQWQKSPENPMNQESVAYNAKRS